MATWSLVAFVLELRCSMAAASTEALSQLPVVAVLLGGAVLTSFTHERRVGKMVGPAGEAVFDGAGRMWLRVFAALVTASALAMVASAPQRIFEVWIVGVGSGLAFWGWRAGFAWYVGLGAAMIATAAVDVVLGSAGLPVFALRGAVLALALPAAALVINRRFLWFHPPRDR